VDERIGLLTILPHTNRGPRLRTGGTQILCWDTGQPPSVSAFLWTAETLYATLAFLAESLICGVIRS
jgi:hypothetical protein